MKVPPPGLVPISSIPEWVAEFFVLSQPLRMGLEAYLSLGKKKPTSIHIVHAKRNINIEVKAAHAYPSFVVDNVTPSKDHFLAFVVYNDKFEDLSVVPKVFIVPSVEVARITKHINEERRVTMVGLAKYKDNWAALSGAR